MSFVSDRSIDGVLSRMEFMVRVRGARLIAVDYLQAIAHRDAPSTRERIDRSLEELIAHAGRLGVPLVLASQLARPDKGNPFREPQLIDLKESGSIENRSAAVVLLWRESDRPGEPTRAKVAKVKRRPAGSRFSLVRGSDGQLAEMETRYE
jgi:replicative DNA helicase